MISSKVDPPTTQRTLSGRAAAPQDAQGAHGRLGDLARGEDRGGDRGGGSARRGTFPKYGTHVDDVIEKKIYICMYKCPRC